MKMRWAWTFLASAGLAQGQGSEAIPAVTAPPLPAYNPLPAYAPVPNEAVVAPPAAQGGGRLWGDAEYLLWRVRREGVPPLIAELPRSQINNSAVDPSVAVPVLYPHNGRSLDYGTFNGLKLRLGGWFDADQMGGVESSGFVVEQRDRNAAFVSRPGGNAPSYYYVTPSVGSTPINTYLHANPDTSTNRFGGFAHERPAFGGEIDGLYRGTSLLADRVDYLVGFRYFDFRENLAVQSTLTDNAGGLIVDIGDHFAASNQFYGVNFGFRSTFYNARGLSAEATFKTAFGTMVQRVKIDGYNTLVDQTGANTQPFGVYARPTNSGNRQRDRFAAMPELDLKLGYALTSRVKVTLGYDLVYVSTVVRPGQAIDPVVSDTNIRFVNHGGQTPNNDESRPQFGFRASDLWMQGLNLGFSIDF